MKHFVFLLIFFCLVGSDLQADEKEHRIYKIERELMNGNKQALVQIAKYFGSEKQLVEYLGYHRLESTVGGIAARIARENCMFLDSEFKFSESTTKREFLKFFNEREEEIVFSDLANAFIITPFDQRDVVFELSEISEKVNQEAEHFASDLGDVDWANENEIPQAITKGDPQVLVQIASLFAKARGRFNHHNYNLEEYIKLIHYLTGVNVSVRNEKGELIFHLQEDFGRESKINLLIFLAKYVDHFKWDAQNRIFRIVDLPVTKLIKERVLFENMTGPFDSNRIEAYVQLTVSDSAVVSSLSKEYDKLRMGFDCKAVRALSKLTAVCRAKNKDYEGAAFIRESVVKLNGNISKKTRYAIEQDLIEKLTLDNITAFEYWAIVYDFGQSIYSAGRVIDIFYSKHWQEILSDSNEVLFYMKKSALYSQLGISGICGVFHRKFFEADVKTLEMISGFKSNDKDITEQVRLIKHINSGEVKREIKITREWAGNYDVQRNGVVQSLDSIRSSELENAEEENAIRTLLSEINFEQIKPVTIAIEDYQFKYKGIKYSYLNSDWSFFTDSFENDSLRQDLLSRLDQYSETELYKYYLNLANVRFRKANQSLDYDLIYDMLKYDVAGGFTGGGGGRRSNHVFSIIKLLEFEFKTTLGFPIKCCNSGLHYGCSADDRAFEWMNYFEENNLLENNHDEPISFNTTIR
jgi:hypothetical protein